MRFVAKAISTFFGAGYFPIAPGTFASLLAAGFYLAWLSRLSVLVYFCLLLALTIVGILSASLFARSLGHRDPRPVVIDEVCGQLFNLAWAPRSAGPVAAAFVLFRLFDIAKPFPIRRLERLPWGWGIMADDVLAGVYGLAVLQIGLQAGILWGVGAFIILMAFGAVASRQARK
jgi:phosphatidylglycerophosphatase A